MRWAFIFHFKTLAGRKVERLLVANHTKDRRSLKERSPL